MTKDEALKLALEALHGFIPYLPLNDEAQCGRYDEAIIAIKDALAQPEQEPVAWMWDINNGGGYTSRGIGLYQTDIPFAKHTPLYAHPPQRTWVGLTDEEIWTVLQFRGYSTDTIEIAKAIEARLKQKNFD